MGRRDFHVRRLWRFQEEQRRKNAACQNEEAERRRVEREKMGLALKGAIQTRTVCRIEDASPYWVEMTDEEGNGFAIPFMPENLPTLWHLLDLAGWPDGKGKEILDRGEVVLLRLTGRIAYLRIARHPEPGGERPLHYVQIDYPEEGKKHGV